MYIYLNVFLPSKPASPKWSLYPRFPHHNPVYAFPIRYIECLIVARTSPVQHVGINELEGYCVNIRLRKKMSTTRNSLKAEDRAPLPPPVHARKCCCRILLASSVENDVSEENCLNHLWGDAVAYRGGIWGGSNLPEIPKALQNRAKLNPIVKTVKNCWI